MAPSSYSDSVTKSYVTINIRKLPRRRVQYLQISLPSPGLGWRQRPVSIFSIFCQQVTVCQGDTPHCRLSVFSVSRCLYLSHFAPHNVSSVSRDKTGLRSPQLSTLFKLFVLFGTYIIPWFSYKLLFLDQFQNFCLLHSFLYLVTLGYE